MSDDTYNRPLERAPDVTAKNVGAFLLVAGLLLGATEIGLRTAEVGASLNDDVRLWSLQRARLHGDAIALVGSSRFQIGLDPAVISEQTQKPVINLALLGDSPLPVLEHVAAEQEFLGHVVVEFMPLRMCTPDADDIATGRAFLKRWERRGALAEFEGELRATAQSTFVLLNSSIRARDVTFGHQSLTQIRQQSVHLDRASPRDYREANIDAIIALRERLWAEKLGRSQLSDAELGTRIDDVRLWVEHVRKRGGRTTFFRINSSGRAAELEEQYAPRSECWERYRAAIPQARWLHFETLPEIATLELPEGSHADASQTHAISAGLAGLFVP